LNPGILFPGFFVLFKYIRNFTILICDTNKHPFLRPRTRLEQVPGFILPYFYLEQIRIGIYANKNNIFYLQHTHICINLLIQINNIWTI